MKLTALVTSMFVFFALLDQAAAWTHGAPVVIPPSTGDILLVDGISLIIQTDAASFVCIAGGC